MDFLKKLLICVLIVLTLNLYLPGTDIAQQLHAKADVPKHSPQSWSSPEIKITKPKEKPKKKSNWLCGILGIVIVAGGAAALAGGGDDESDQTNNGNFNFSW